MNVHALVLDGVFHAERGPSRPRSKAAGAAGARWNGLDLYAGVVRACRTAGAARTADVPEPRPARAPPFVHLAGSGGSDRDGEFVYGFDS
jgi:hypothetical protein